MKIFVPGERKHQVMTLRSETGFEMTCNITAGWLMCCIFQAMEVIQTALKHDEFRMQCVSSMSKIGLE
ncbi:MAG: hypothetical protein ED559_00240 [Phycisphaera sp.]|nr:MAG: hypothetical protein ED559_00240 [Phycisphaera sp.]